MDAFIQDHVCAICGDIGTNSLCNHCSLAACKRCRANCCVKIPCSACRKSKNWALRCDRCGKNVCAACAPSSGAFVHSGLCRRCCSEQLAPCFSALSLVAVDLTVSVRRKIEGVTT